MRLWSDSTQQKCCYTDDKGKRSCIGPKEIIDVVQRWGSYKGRRITEDKVRAWLNRFGPVPASD